MNEKQEVRKWHIHQTVHDELDDTQGQTWVTTFQGQLKAVPTVSETTVNRNYFTLGSYSYSHLYSTAYSFRQTFTSRQICLLVSWDMAVWGLITTANVQIFNKPHVWIVPGLHKYSKNLGATSVTRQVQYCGPRRYVTQYKTQSQWRSGSQDLCGPAAEGKVKLCTMQK